jgi:hypothetical protein
MHPNILTSPDDYVFCSNYPQPEFIVRLQSNKAFIPESFVVRSKETRVFNGVPIAAGLIFVADNLEDLGNTKAFTRMTEKEINKWFQERYTGALKGVPALPCEPIAYFNLDEKLEISLDVSKVVTRPIKYVKFIPTAFRKKPINFSSKSFNENQVECQFFGVNGYEVVANSHESDQWDQVAQRY